MLEILKSISENAIVIYVLPVLFRVLLAVAVNLDCRARNIASRVVFTIATAVFPIIAGFVYLIKRKSLPKAFKICNTCSKKVGTYTNTCPHCGGLFLTEYTHPAKRKLQIISVILCVISLICYGVYSISELPDNIDAAKNIISGNIADEDESDVESDYDYDEDIEIGSSELSYDRNHLAYTNETDVKYYNKSGETYVYINDDDNEYFISEDNGNKIDVNNAYVDKEGYFIVINDALTHMENDPYSYTISAGVDTPAKTIDVAFCDEDGNTYYRATEASWNYSGKMLICGNTIN